MPVSYGVRMEDDLEADSLDELFESLVPLDDLLHEIRRCIISEEEISDDASSTLKHIRRAMKQTNQKIHTQLTTLVSSASNQDKLQGCDRYNAKWALLHTSQARVQKFIPRYDP